MDWSQLTPDQAAAVQAAIGKTQAGGSAPSAPVSKEQALQLLADAYAKSGGQITPYIQNFGAQYGITPDQVQQTVAARQHQYDSSGTSIVDWTKDLAGLVGVVGGASALAGGLGGAAAGGGGAATGGGLGAGTVVGPGGLPTAEAAIGAGQAAGTGAGIGDAAGGGVASGGGGVSHWLKLGNQLRGLLPHPQQQQPQMANLLQSSDPTRSALVQQLLARALRHG